MLRQLHQRVRGPNINASDLLGGEPCLVGDSSDNMARGHTVAPAQGDLVHCIARSSSGCRALVTGGALPAVLRAAAVEAARGLLGEVVLAGLIQQQRPAL